MTKTVKKVVAGISALVILGGVAVGAWAVMENSRSSYPSFDQIEADDEYTSDLGEAVTDENGNELDSGAVIPMAKAMTFRSATSLDGRNAAYDSVTVEATITPETANLKSLVYSVSWANASSAWASGKNVLEYVNVTQSEANSKTATIQCLQPFGEQVQIKVTATSIDSSSAFATCTVDFMKRVANWSGQFFDGPPVPIDLDTSEIRLSSLSVSDGMNVDHVVEYTAYTVDDDISVSVNLSADDDILSSAQSTVGIELFGRSTSCLGKYVSFLSVVANGSMNALSESSMSQYVSPFREWLYKNKSSAVFFLQINIRSDKHSIEKKIPIYFSDSGIAVPVSDVTLSPSEVVI